MDEAYDVACEDMTDEYDELWIWWTCPEHDMVKTAQNLSGNGGRGTEMLSHVR